MPLYGWVGLAVLLVSETGTLARIEPFWTWHTAIAWTGYILLVDAIVWKRRGSSWNRGAPAEFAFLAGLWSKRAASLMLAGLICGFLWEFWNYWARARWVYTVPILPDLKIFEMPVLGYLGFPAFALECFTMYVFVRHWLWSGPTRRIAAPNLRASA